MAYATAAEMMARFDSRRLAQLVSDTGTPVSVADLPSDANLSAALEDASGAVDAAAFVGRRYDRTKLVGLSGGARYLLVRLVCDLCFAYLVSRRGLSSGETANLAPRYAEAMKLLQLLRDGERVFASDGGENDAAAEAGLMTTAEWMKTATAGRLVEEAGRFFGVGVGRDGC